MRCGTEELNKNKYTAVLKAYEETHYDAEGEMEQRGAAVLGVEEEMRCGMRCR